MKIASSPKTIRLVVWLFVYAMAAFAATTAHGLEPGVKLSQYAHKAWQLGDAGLLGTPQDIAQTLDGYIWVSTSDGLFRFDGIRFAKWEPPPGESLPSSSLWYLFGARNGSLYAGTDRGLSEDPLSDGHGSVNLRNGKEE
jgi:ligand-binding sensor domain-containing protein